jgi:hypothetical protein
MESAVHGACYPLFISPSVEIEKVFAEKPDIFLKIG